MAYSDTGLPLFVGDDKISRSPLKHSSRRRGRLLHSIGFVTLALLLSASYYRYGWRCWNAPPKPVEVTTLGIPKKIQQAWAAHSPYFPAAEYVAPPERCEVIQVHLFRFVVTPQQLQRHGSRFPTPSNTKKIKKPLRKILNAGSYSGQKYQFLSEFEWDLGDSDLLPLGAKEALDSGSQHYLRYKHLVRDDQLPFVRASDSERVVLSAERWTHGFSAASGHVYSPYISVVISEEKDANNTLDGSQCPNAKGKKKPAKAWRDKFVPHIVERFNKDMPGAKLGNKDLVELMPLCAFETLFHEDASPFCGLFTAEEWQAREYYDDLEKYYKTGHGNSLGPVQGVGYVNELLARLTGHPVRDQTQTNETLDSSPETFPLDRSFYADFSHDNHMVAIYSAIGLFRPDEPPSTDRLDPARIWRISKMTPFSGRLITEKLQCGDDAEYVRMLVNDAVQPLEFCGGNEDGLCTLEAFVESQGYARSNGAGDWEKCFD